MRPTSSPLKTLDTSNLTPTTPVHIALSPVVSEIDIGRKKEENKRSATMATLNTLQGPWHAP